MNTIKPVDKAFALINFCFALFIFAYHFSEDVVISLIIPVNVLLFFGLFACIKHEDKLKDFEKSVGDKIRNRKAKRRMTYARQVQGQCHR